MSEHHDGVPKGSSPAVEDGERARTRRVLRERARLLARPLHRAVVEETLDFVTLDLDGAGYAVDAEMVRGVFPLRDLTPLPTAPAWVMGITNVRGAIVAVIDLAAVLSGGKQRRAHGRVVLVDVAGVELGIDVAACAVVRIPRSRLGSRQVAPGTFLRDVSVEGRAVLDMARFVAETRRTATPLEEGAAG